MDRERAPYKPHHSLRGYVCRLSVAHGSVQNMASEKKIDTSLGDDHREFTGDPVADQRRSDETAHADLQIGTERRTRIEKKLKRKLDARFSILIVIYILNYIDRNNLAQARLKGLEADLRLKGQEYATLLSILYVGYILMQIPSNMILNKISKPSWYLAGAMIIWGMISVLTGITTGFVGCLLTRFFLGFIEAAFLPGALLMLSKWYKRDEISLRYTILYCGNLISNAFGSLIAAGVLANMEGLLGHRAWRWLFFIEGAITMFVAILAGVILPDYPQNSSGFTEEELQVARLRMFEDVGEVDEDSKDQHWSAGFKMAVTDWKLYVLMFSLTSCVTGLSFNAYFPTLTQTLGYGTTQTLLLVAPPWVLSCIVALINSWHSDRTQEKFWHATWPLVLGCVGFIIGIATKPTAIAARYVSLFMQASSYPGYVVMYSWMASSFPRPPAKRAVALALMNAFSQLGNIAGSYVWDKKFGPTYRNSYIIVLIMFAVTIGLNFFFRQVLVAANRRLAAGEEAFAAHEDNIEAAARLEHASKDEIALMRQGFRYLI